MGNSRKLIESGRAVLGIEFGSTRIKAVLVGEDYMPVATGEHVWENQLEDGFWTYSLEAVWAGVQDCYRKMAESVREKYGIVIRRLGGIGISAMMHGYMPFDAEGNLLVPFRTWRNTTALQAATQLSELFDFNIPPRWSIAHLYQAILNGEPHVEKIRFLTTLEGYVHWKLTGERVLGAGEASGMFPLDYQTCSYHPRMLEAFCAMEPVKAYPWELLDILPKIRMAGERAGMLTEEGARLLDVSGNLESGVPFAPPEGDVETGMVATNSVVERTGNISAGTSIFTTVILEKELDRAHREIGIFATPSGRPAAMVHSSTCSLDINAWMRIWEEFAACFGVTIGKDRLYETLFRKAMEGNEDCGGLLAFNCYSGEPVIGLEDGRPLLARKPDASFGLANFVRSQLYAALAVMRIGCDILFREEHVKVDRLYGHGGLFKTAGVMQRLLAGAMGAPVEVLDTAGEGGPWGMALLAAYMVNREAGETLEAFLEHKVFVHAKSGVAVPDPEDAKGIAAYIAAYQAALPLQEAACMSLPLR